MPRTHQLSDQHNDSPLAAVLKFSGAIFSICLSSLVIWIARQPTSDNHTCCDMISDKVYRLCHHDKTVSSELAKDPSQPPAKLFHKLYHEHKLKEKLVETKKSTDDRQDDLHRAYECGNWGTAKPSTLFLKVRLNIPSRIYSEASSNLHYQDIPRRSLYVGQIPSGRSRLSTSDGQSRSRSLDHRGPVAGSVSACGKLYRSS